MTNKLKTKKRSLLGFTQVPLLFPFPTFCPKTLRLYMGLKYSMKKNRKHFEINGLAQCFIMN